MNKKRIQFSLQSRDGAYFGYMLPESLPYVDQSAQAKVTTTFRQVAARMEKLQDSLELSGLDGDTFSEYVKVLFDSRFDRFEEMSAKQLAEYAQSVHDGLYEAKHRLEWPNAYVVVDTAFTTTEEWETIRRIGIGGSDGAITMNIPAYRSKYDLYHDKVMTPIKIPTDTDKQAIFERGHVWEKNVVQAFCDMTGAEVIPETRMFRSKKNECSLADIDAIIRFPATNTIAFFEAKSTIAENFDAWANDKVPGHYIPQTRQYPAVMDDPRVKGVYIGCLFTYDYTIHGIYDGSDSDVGRFVSRYIERDENEENVLLEIETDFYQEHILANQEPPFTGPFKNDLESLRSIVGYADPEQKAITLEEEFADQIQEYLFLAKQKSALTAQADTIQEKMRATSLPLIEILGSTIEGQLFIPDDPDGKYWEVKYAPRRQTKVDLEKLQHKYPEVFMECVEENPDAFRVFSIHEKKPKKPKK